MTCQAGLMYWLTRLRRKKRSVVLGGERVPIEPLGLEAALELGLLLAPYVAGIERHLPELKAALEATNGRRPQLLTAAMRALVGEMRQAPGDLTRAVALLVGRDPEWVALHALPAEVVQALPVLDEANDFGALLEAIRGLGLVARFEEIEDGT